MKSKSEEDWKKEFIVVSIVLVLLAATTTLLLIKSHYEGKHLGQNVSQQSCIRD